MPLANKLITKLIRPPCQIPLFRHRTITTDTINNDTNTIQTSVQSRPRQIMSGIQPTGTLHLGNYLCAIKQWITEQTNYKLQSINNNQQSCMINKPLYSIVDLHAITVRHNPAQLRSQCINLTATLLACGIDPQYSTIYIQSHIPAHTELQWILSCQTPQTWLNKMTQYKEKSNKIKQFSSTESITLGLYSYPVLQSSDILLYNTTHVPVGDDQLQHIELTRDIAQHFHSRYATDIFTIPESILINTTHNRIMSLRDGTQKMSKSDVSDLSRINLTDTDEQIIQKIKRCKTDSITGILTYDIVQRPDISNLLNIYSLLTVQSVNSILNDNTINYSKQIFKHALTEQLIETIKPIRNRINEYANDVPYIESLWNTGAIHANTIAEHTMDRVKKIIGLPTRIV